MSLKTGEEIGSEVHAEVDQFFRIEEGEGKVVMNGEETPFKGGDCFIVPAGTEHNVINTGAEELKLYTLYSPPNHPDGTIHATKADAMAAEGAEHGEEKTEEELAEAVEETPTETEKSGDVEESVEPEAPEEQKE